MNTVSVPMILNEPKKHSVRYDADKTSEPNPATTSIYISKSYLPSPAPENLTVTISWE